MSKYKKVYRCKNCLKVYPYKLSMICDKCGLEIGERKIDIPMMPGMKISFNSYSDISTVVPTDNCEIVIARKKFFRWKVKKGY